uniref:Uncharacterized protein n=1 Tax=Oryza brachyantha TaxID=4533 RepID=J3NAZ9_ORYBR
MLRNKYRAYRRYTVIYPDQGKQNLSLQSYTVNKKTKCSNKYMIVIYKHRSAVTVVVKRNKLVCLGKLSVIHFKSIK